MDIHTDMKTSTLSSNSPSISVLQREQMVEAQEMFRTSNKVTRPEKALILGFMAGSRGVYQLYYTGSCTVYLSIFRVCE